MGGDIDLDVERDHVPVVTERRRPPTVEGALHDWSLHSPGREPLRVERQLGEFEQLGATAPDGVDLVVVGHIADVAAYLCGSGSDVACTIADQLGEQITSDPAITYFDRARGAGDRPDNESAHRELGTGSLR